MKLKSLKMHFTINLSIFIEFDWIAFNLKKTIFKKMKVFQRIILKKFISHKNMLIKNLCKKPLIM